MEAADGDAIAVVLLGSPRYYRARGFVPASRYGLADPFAGVLPGGFEIGEEDFQIAVIDAEGARGLSGEVQWHPAFG